MRIAYLLVCFLIAAGLPVRSASAQVPSPLEHFGFTPGEHRKLANWTELTAYYERVAAGSDRVTLDTLGVTTRGLPLVMFTITSPENQDRLSEIRDVHLRLADPRTIATGEELARLKEAAKTIVMVTSHIHSTEVGAGQMPANLVYRLATSDDADVMDILDQTVLLHIPSLNPDGTELVSNWYRRYVGTEFEGAYPVELYHPYVGHDNNRDWYAFTQVETQLTVEKAHNVWRPMIVHDVHQMGSTGARIFVPPYVEPFERNVDPLIIAAINQLGSYMAAEMTTRGLTGVVSGAQYDLFTPARAYQHYHGGVRILSETASAQLATPIFLLPEELRDGRGFEVNRASMNFPSPWGGGQWGTPQITEYQEAGVMALLKNAARNRRFWIDNFYEINRRAVEKWATWPEQWVIPAERVNQKGLDAVLRILTMGSVEVHRALEPFSAGGRSYAAGSYVIPMRQPYASWAQTMLEVQEYPNLRDYPDGPPTRPYDVTAHTLPLLMGIEADAIAEPLQLQLSRPIDPVPMQYESPPALSGRGAPRVAIYKGWRESMPAGWTRWVFDQHGIAYDTLHDAQVRAGNLSDRYDVILFQDQPPAQILSGWSGGELPAEYSGGIGAEGSAALQEFVHDGGRIVAVESAAQFVIDLFSLPIGNAVAGLSATDFYIPGSILRLNVETENSLFGSLERENIAWFWRSSRTFAADDPRVRVLARYGSGDPRLSGWVLGADRVAGEPAVVEVEVGLGSVVLFGFQPNYRGQSIATWPLLFSSLSAGL